MKKSMVIWNIVNNLVGIFLIYVIVKKVRAARARRREAAQWAE